MSKNEFVSRFLKDQAERKKNAIFDMKGYHADATRRMKRLYRGDLLRGAKRYV